MPKCDVQCDAMLSEDNKKSSLVSRNVTILGRRTSIRLEPEMWKALTDIARREQCRIHDICSLVFLRKGENTSFTAAIRVFLMLYYRAAATEEGHNRAGHGHIQKMLKRARMSEYMVPSHFKQANESSDKGLDPAFFALGVTVSNESFLATGSN